MVKGFVFVAMLIVAETRKVQDNTRFKSGPNFKAGSSASRADEVGVHVGVCDWDLQTMMADPNFQELANCITKSIEATLTDPHFQAQAEFWARQMNAVEMVPNLEKHLKLVAAHVNAILADLTSHDQAVLLARHIHAMVSDPSFGAQVMRTAGEIEATLVNQSSQDQANSVATEIDVTHASRTFKEQVRRIAEHLQAMTFDKAHVPKDILANRVVDRLVDKLVDLVTPLKDTDMKSTKLDKLGKILVPPCQGDLQKQARFIVDEMESLFAGRSWQEQASRIAKEVEDMITDAKIQQQTTQVAENIRAMMVDQNYKEQANVLAEKVQTMMADRNLQHRVMRIAEQVTVLMADPHVEESAHRLAEQVEALFASLDVQGRATLVAEHAQDMKHDLIFNRKAKQIAHQMEMLMADPYWQEQANRLAAEMAKPDLRLQKSVEHVAKQIEVMKADPKFQELAKVVAEQMEAMMLDPRNQQQAEPSSQEVAHGPSRKLFPTSADISDRAAPKEFGRRLRALKEKEIADAEVDLEAGKLTDVTSRDASSDMRSASLMGYVLSIGIAALSATVTLATGFASKSTSLPHYTENFYRCLAASITMFILCVGGRVKVMQDSKTMRSSMWLAAADWFFLWGYVEAMAYLDTTQMAATTISMSSILSVILGAALLSERTTVTKVLAMLRNVVVVILVTDPFGFFTKHGDSYKVKHLHFVTQNALSGNSKLTGFAWGLVACLGTVFMRIVQRSLKDVPSTVTSFWCFAINTLLWFPPGCIPPEIRVPLLWPKTPSDSIGLLNIPATVWLSMLASGIMGALMIAGQAITLKYIDVGTYTPLVSSLNLVFGFILDAIFTKAPRSLRVDCGILLAVIGIAVEGFVTQAANKRMQNAAKQSETTTTQSPISNSRFPASILRRFSAAR